MTNLLFIIQTALGLGCVLLFLILVVGLMILGIQLWLLNPIPEKSYLSTLEIFDGKQLLFTVKGKISMLKLTDTQQSVGKLEFVDGKGKFTDVPDGNVVVLVKGTGDTPGEEVASADYDDAKNEVTVKAVGPGVAALSIKAKNKAGEDLPFDDIAIEVTAGDAKSGRVVFGEPTEQPQEGGS